MMDVQSVVLADEKPEREAVLISEHERLESTDA